MIIGNDLPSRHSDVIVYNPSACETDDAGILTLLDMDFKLLMVSNLGPPDGWKRMEDAAAARGLSFRVPYRDAADPFGHYPGIIMR